MDERLLSGLGEPAREYLLVAIYAFGSRGAEVAARAEP